MKDEAILEQAHTILFDLVVKSRVIDRVFFPSTLPDFKKYWDDIQNKWKIASDEINRMLEEKEEKA